jgi:hypothetical protein
MCCTEKLAGRMGNMRKQLKSSPVMGLGINAQLPHSSLKSVLHLDTILAISYELNMV